MTEPLASGNGTHTHTHDHGDHGSHEEFDGHRHPPFGLFTSSIVPAPFIPVILCDVVIKWVLLCAGRLPDFSLNRALQVLLHLLVPIAVVTLYAIGWQFDKEEYPIITYLDPLTTIALCIISAVMIFPAFCAMKPFVFADTPQCFDIEKFTSEISSHSDGIHCTHIHVYRIWPKESFEALIHINIEVNKSEEKWSDLAAARYSAISKFIRSAMKKGGAEKVVIEPRFIDRSIDNPEWQGCIEGAKCYVEDRGCCSMVNHLVHTQA